MKRSHYILGLQIDELRGLVNLYVSLFFCSLFAAALAAFFFS